MGIKDTVVRLSKTLKLDSHHAIERFGVVFGVLSVTGLITLGGSGAAAYQAGRNALGDKAQYTQSFTTSKTNLKGEVEGVYRNDSGTKTLVVMNFGERTQISYNAADYQAFLLGSDFNLNSEKVATPGLTGSFHVFGSTGYVGVLLEAREPFARQVLNLTIRANAELSFADQVKSGDTIDKLAGDPTFARYDQWRVFFNPAAQGARHIQALDTPVFDPARAYYDVVVKDEETTARANLDNQLVKMRADLSQINAYTSDLQTTKVDDVFLRPPTVPASIRSDKVTGQTAAEAGATKPGSEGTLTLQTSSVVPRGFNFDWRAGNVYSGYLDKLVPPGSSYVQYLTQKSSEKSDDSGSQIASMTWILSDGTDLKKDYPASDVAMRPLANVMNNLSQAYQDYFNHKAEYQSDLLPKLLNLDVELRNVQSNSSARSGDFLVVYH